MKPLTRLQLVEAFGDPEPYIDGEGRISRDWETAILAYARLPEPLPLSWDSSIRVTRFRCHKRLVGAFEAALRTVHADPAAWATIGDFGGCYAFRANRRDRRRLSAHCWGAAIDLDVADNPQGKPGDVHPVTIDAFEMQGFLWGGRFSGLSEDPMHLEFVDVARLT